jgi:hypothetical protein
MKQMTVGDLIERLEMFDKNEIVMFSYEYGDYWNTTVAEPVRGISTGKVKYSEYHSAFKVLEDENSPYLIEEENPEMCKDVIIIS